MKLTLPVSELHYVVGSRAYWQTATDFNASIQKKGNEAGCQGIISNNLWSKRKIIEVPKILQHVALITYTPLGMLRVFQVFFFFF